MGKIVKNGCLCLDLHLSAALFLAREFHKRQRHENFSLLRWNLRESVLECDDQYEYNPHLWPLENTHLKTHSGEKLNTFNRYSIGSLLYGILETVEHLDECENQSRLLCETLALSLNTNYMLYCTISPMPWHCFNNRCICSSQQTKTPFCLKPIHTTIPLCL